MIHATSIILIEGFIYGSTYFHLMIRYECVLIITQLILTLEFCTVDVLQEEHTKVNSYNWHENIKLYSYQLSDTIIDVKRMVILFKASFWGYSLNMSFIHHKGITSLPARRPPLPFLGM